MVTSSDSIDLLARTYCGSCHLHPEPDLLDKNTWEKKVLPNMGYRFGIYTDRERDSLIEKGVAEKIVNASGVFPERQMISNEVWASIKRYYIDHAPESLVNEKKKVNTESILFTPIITDFKLQRPAISALYFHGHSKTLFVADCSLEKNSTIHIFNSRFTLLHTLGLPHPVSNITVHKDTVYILMMGHLIPSDEPAGSLVKAITDKNGNYIGYRQVLKELKRPVDIVFTDLDNDGDDEILVCEYGNHTGSLSLFVKRGKNKYKKEVLQAGPGSIKVIVQDMNQDAYKDIVVLTAQGDERIDIYYNDGKGKFIKETIIRFPSVYGSVSFSLADINEDGFSDIIYVNGDNGDLSPVLKPYHGVRVFLNDRHNHFTESFFFPMHGAYKAIVKDFDMDGDLDIAAIAFFPDFENHADQGFVYLENKSGKKMPEFIASTFPGSANGRWITMASGDIDGDGDEDLILGSFTSMEIPGDSSGKKLAHLRSNSPSLLFLKNTARKKRLQN